MVLMNGSKYARYTNSIINRNSGGGSKKAGLPSSVGVTSWDHVAYNNHGLPLSLKNIRKNRFKRFPNMNRPLGFNYPIHMR